MHQRSRRRAAQSLRGGARAIALVGSIVLSTACEESGAEVQEPVPHPDANAVEYPVALWDRKVEGETEVLVHVSDAGAVDSAVVSQSSGYAEFDSAAVSGARRLRFTPGRRGERRVAMWTRIPIRFAQDSTATLGAPRASGVRNE